MIKLTREVRFSIQSDSPAIDRTESQLENKAANSWGGSPAPISVAPFVILRCTVAGELEPESNYVCNIKVIDELVRQQIVTPVCDNPQQFRSHSSLLDFSVSQIGKHLPKHLLFCNLEIKTTPFHSFSWNHSSPDMTLLTEQFEFSASHRLHNPKLSDEENRQLFGKCNHPNGHGHNYVVDVTISTENQGQSDSQSSELDLIGFERVVKETVIDPLDHKHLNVDVVEFQKLNPTVENIAQTIFDWLEDRVQSVAGCAKLRKIRVYETPKTWAEIEKNESC